MSEEIEQFNNDGALLDAFGALGSGSLTAEGRAKAASALAEMAQELLLLDARTLDNLFRTSWLARRIICTYPEDAGGVGWQWVFGTAKKDKLSTKMDQYCERLKLRHHMVSASIEARHHGDGYILIGVADGLDLDKPIGNVRTIEWLECLTHRECYPAPGHEYTEFPEFYQVSGTRRHAFVHHSRILRFRGAKLYGDMLRDNGGKNDPVLQQILTDVGEYQRVKAGSVEMVTNHSNFVYGLKGLAKLVLDGQSDKLLRRLITVRMGMDLSKAVMVDAEAETANFIQRNYGGVDKLVETTKENLVAASGMSRTKLLGSSAVGGLGTANRGDGDREDDAIALNKWQHNNWLEPLDQIKEIILSAQDGPTRGRKVECSVVFPSTILLTDAEKADLRLKTLQGLKIAKEIDVLHPDEIRQSLYGGPEFSPEIQLIEGLDMEGYRQEKRQAMQTALEQQQANQDPQNKANDTQQAQPKQDALDLSDFAKVAQADLDRARLAWERNPPSEEFQGILASSTEF